MDVKALLKNISYSFKTTASIADGLKRMVWLYTKAALLGYKQTQITFKYQPPVGKVKLQVRFNGGSDVFILSEVFEHHCYQTSLQNITNIIDLGANAGFTAVYFSKIYPNATIVCVEPLPENLEILQKNILLNKVKSVIIKGAVTIHDQEVLIEVGDMDYGGKIHDIPFGKNMANATFTVDGYSMDTIMKKAGFKNVDLLKIDIEGYEGVLFSDNTAWLDKVNTIIMEIHEGVSIEYIKNTAIRHGFKNVIQQNGNWILTK